MKQKLFLSLLIVATGFLAVDAQSNSSLYSRYTVPCEDDLVDSSCNMLVNPIFRFTNDSLEAFSNGDVFMWQDVNGNTADINGGGSFGWTLPIVPAYLQGANYASMYVDNYAYTTEGIAGRMLPVDSGRRYAMSFFLASSAAWLGTGGNYCFKIYLTNCQDVEGNEIGNPRINGRKQLIYCKNFSNVGDSSWQQYLISFTADSSYNMIVIYPELPAPLYNAYTYVHFLYPELIPVNPTSWYSTYIVPPDTLRGNTMLSACGLTNATYQWTGPNGVVSTNQTDVLGYDPEIGENDEYSFSMMVEGACGNDPVECEDAKAPVITQDATRLATVERVTCVGPITPTNNCNIIPNATFDYTGTQNVSAFKLETVRFWSSMNISSPDVILINNPSYPSNTPPLTPYSGQIPPNAKIAGMGISVDVTSLMSYEGIYTRIPRLVSGRKYALSFFLNVQNTPFAPASDFVLNISLSNCQIFPYSEGSNNVAPVLGAHQDIFCQTFNQISTSGWQQYFITFTASANYNLITVYPQANLSVVGANYINFLYPELIDVTAMASLTETTACHYELDACGVTNAIYEWYDGNNVSIGNSNHETVDPATNPGPYTVTISVPHITDNPILHNDCSDNVQNISATAYMNLAAWTGTISTAWNNPSNWVAGVVPDDPFTDVLIPAAAINQPVIRETFQVHNIVIEPNATLINNGTLKIAGSITSDPAGISNYEGADVVGSIEMNGTCGDQTLAGNVFGDNSVTPVVVDNDVLNFTASNNVTISSTSGEGLDVYGELGFGSATSTTLTTNGNLTLKSTASLTANVAQIDASNFIDGAVTVERHILTGTGSGEHARTWQALATPTGANSTSQSVYDSWMESGNTPVGYGTHIPDPRSDWNPRGFDYAPGGAFGTAIKTYNSGSNVFDPIGYTSDPLYNKNGYFLFVRGDRSIDEINLDPNPTNLRSKGALFQPHTGYAPPSITAPAWTSSPGKYVMVGNPYASTIDLDYMYSHYSTYFNNLNGIFVVWDVSIPGTLGYGGYQYIDATSSPTPFSVTPGGTGNYYESTGSYSKIESGQAFFVQATGNGSTGTISFDEYAKSSTSRIVTRGINNTAQTSVLWAGLYSATGICDGTSITFGKEYSNEIGKGDAGKLENPGENFMIIKGNGAALAIEKRQPINQSDTIFYAFNNLRTIKYQLVFSPVNLQEEGLHAMLIDNYLHSETPLSLVDSSFIDFTVDDNKSSFENRFMIVFQRTFNPGIVKHNVPATRSILVYPNPVENRIIKIGFINQPIGRYAIQLINNMGQVVYNSTIKISNTNTTSSFKLGSSVSSGSYELSIIAPDGKKLVQKIVIK